MESKSRHRVFLSVFFFLSGVCFSTWASRIPTIKSNFQFNDAELGTLLLCMPISSLIGLPISGWLVSRFNSRGPIITGFVSLAVALSLIGFATSVSMIVIAVSMFAFSMRIMNIAINTQALSIQRMYDKRINGSFHGLWSTGGIAGVGISTLFVSYDISMHYHLFSVALVAVAIAAYSYQFLLRNDRPVSGNKLQLGKPDPYIVYLGIMIFLAAVCEGGMFDWSGVYFREVVNEKIFTLGYLIFMIFMSLSRFVSDRVMEEIGMPKTFILSASLVVIGILSAVLFPTFWPSMIGFCLVGFGAAAVVPMTFLLAGQSKKYSPGIAISIITTYSTVGMLLGPPLIGYISNALNLRIAFVTFGLAGLLMIPFSQLFFRHQRLKN
jgi:MFS family permease